MRRLRGLVDLLGDAVVHGSTAVERVHREVIRTPYAILERVPALGAPARVVRVVHEGFLRASYAGVRLGARAAAGLAGAAVDAAERLRGERAAAAAGGGGPEGRASPEGTVAAPEPAPHPSSGGGDGERGNPRGSPGRERG